MKAYDDFDRSERYAYGAEEGEEKKVVYERRIYEFSLVKRKDGKYGTLPAQFPFRHLCNILQIHQGDLERAKSYYRDSIKTAEDDARFQSRATRAWKWITTFAPDDFKFQLRGAEDTPAKSKHPAALGALITLLKQGNLEGRPEDDVAAQIYQIIKGHGLEAKVFFQEVYGILVGKPNGPKLASFLVAIGTQRAAQLLERAL